MQQEATVKNQQAALKLVKVRWCPLWRGRCVRRCNFKRTASTACLPGKHEQAALTLTAGRLLALACGGAAHQG